MSSSNVDDLDDLLTWLANVSGVAMLKEFSTETVKRIVGPGAVWPTQQKEDFINAIYLETWLHRLVVLTKRWMSRTSSKSPITRPSRG